MKVIVVDSEGKESELDNFSAFVVLTDSGDPLIVGRKVHHSGVYNLARPGEFGYDRMLKLMNWKIPVLKTLDVEIKDGSS